MQEEIRLIHGAFESKKDTRTIIEPPNATLWDKVKNSFSMGILVSGSNYQNIFSQNSVGICTSASLITGIWNRTGIRYSEDFQYFLQKKYVDNVNLTSMPAWFEGSSLGTALYTANKYGLVKKELVDKYFQRQPSDTYSSYIERLKSVITLEVEQELLASAEKVISYTQITDLSDTNLSSYLNDNKSFVYTRNICGDTWYWKVINGVRNYASNATTKFLEPIEYPTSTYFQPSGHAICLAKYENGKIYANTFGSTWNVDGHGLVAYSPTEAYRVYVNTIPKVVEDNKLPSKNTFKYFFKNKLTFSTKYSYDVDRLQNILMLEQCMEFVPLSQRGYFGIKTFNGVRNFQKKYGIYSTGFVGSLTIAKLNELYGG